MKMSAKTPQRKWKVQRGVTVLMEVTVLRVVIVPKVATVLREVTIPNVVIGIPW